MHNLDTWTWPAGCLPFLGTLASSASSPGPCALTPGPLPPTASPPTRTHSQGLLGSPLLRAFVAQALKDDRVSAFGVEVDGALGVADCRAEEAWLPTLSPAPAPPPGPGRSPSTDMRLRMLLKSIMASTWYTRSSPSSITVMLSCVRATNT